MNLLNHFFAKRSQREIKLFKLLWLTLCFFICFEYFIYPSFLNFQAHKLSKTTALNPQEIERFYISFNATSLSYNQTLELLHQHALSITQTQSQDEKANYTISLKGKIEQERFFTLLHTLASPSMLVSSFALDSKGDFSLTLKNQKILNLSLPSFASINPKTIEQKFSPLPFATLHFFKPQSPKAPLHLQALFNQKAKIDDTWLSVGEKIQDCTLKEITSYSASLMCEDQMIVLQIKRSFQ